MVACYLVKEFPHVVIELVSHPAKCTQAFFERTFNGGRIFETPAKKPESERENRATFLRQIAQPDGVCEPLLKGGLNVLNLLLRDVDPHFLHRIQSEWIDGRWLNCCADGIHSLSSD